MKDINMNEEDLSQIIHKALAGGRGFSLREVVLVGMILVSAASTWYASQSRMDKFDVFTQSFSHEVTERLKTVSEQGAQNTAAINTHLQWEMEHELEQKQAIIDRLSRGNKP